MHFFSILFLGLFFGCSSIDLIQSKPVHTTEIQTVPELIHQHQQMKNIGSDEVKRLESSESEVLVSNTQEKDSEDEVASDAKIDLNYHQRHFKFWKKYFTERDSERFTRHLTNGKKYEELIKRILREQGVPEDLFYVGLIESGYNTHIKSHANAVGPWQFIKGTATRYGLRVSSGVDERRNIHKATVAAAGYFRDLYNIFGSWELALCAYNAGEYRIINAIRRGNTRDYRELVEKKLLPKETIFYIPKVAAAKYLVESETFKVAEVREAKLFSGSDIVEVNSSFSIKKLTDKFDLDRKTLRVLNPDLLWENIKVSRKKGLRIVVPSGNSDDARVIASTIETRKLQRPKKTYLKPVYHTVRRGDNLTKLSRKYGLTVSKLKRVNGLSRSKIFIGQKLLIKKVRSKIYVVKKGDNLYKIARRFGTSINKIISYNDLKGRTIYPAQRIRIPSEG